MLVEIMWASERVRDTVRTLTADATVHNGSSSVLVTTGERISLMDQPYQPPPPADLPTGRPALRIWVSRVAIVLLAVGVLGFIPGITTHYERMVVAGPHATAMLFGLFAVSVLHNVLHLGVGTLGLIAASVGRTARGYLLGSGLGYLALGLYGLFVDSDSPANFLPMNIASSCLLLVLATVMLIPGSKAFRRARQTPASVMDPDQPAT